ncbi:MAG: peptidoglycan DD-metalloendopeptidase family protein [Polyangiaceae bacterium]
MRARFLAPLLLAISMAAHAGPPGQGSARNAQLPNTLGEAEKEIGELDRRIAEIDARAQRATAELNDVNRLYAARGRSYTRMARAGLLPVNGGFDAFMSHVSRVESTRRAIERDLARAQRLANDQREAAVTREALQARRTLLTTHRDALAQAQMASEQALDRQRAFDSAFMPSPSSVKKADDYVAVYSGVTVLDPSRKGEQGFAASRGRLPFPIAGRAEAKVARRSAGRGSGLELAAPVGTSVRSVYAGKVAFSARYSDYGLVVILDHGGGYFSLTGNLGSVDVKVGDEVPSGSRIGAVGDEGRGGMVYLELRHNQDTLEPREWFGL